MGYQKNKKGITLPKEKNIEGVKGKIASIIRCGFLPILVNDKFDPLFLAEIMWELGLPAIEYALRRKDAGEKIPEIKKRFPKMIVLAASTIDDERVVKFLRKREGIFPSIAELYEMGVDGLVSMLPFKEKTYQKYSGKMIFIPGVAVVKEALEELKKGAHLIKFFDTEVYGGVKRIKVLQGPTYGIIPTLVAGGIRPEKVFEYVESNVLVVSAGFDLILHKNYQAVQEKPDRVFITQCLKDYLIAVKEARIKLGIEYLSETEDPHRLLDMTGRLFPWSSA